MEKVAEKSHAQLGPSGWDRWSNCAGSVHLSAGLPNKSSYYAAEGTAAHEIADRCLRDECHPMVFNGQMFQVEGYDIVVDDEMVDAVQDYLALIAVLSSGEGDIVMPEQQVPIGHLTGEVGAEGTSDCIIISNDGKMIRVIDLKYGKGVRVNAEGNGQGRLYALGALKKFAAILEDVELVQIHIHMPRLEGGHTFEVLTISELEEFADEVQLAAGRVAMCAAEPELTPGQKQCKFCLAKGICPALQEEVSSSLTLITASTIEDFADPTQEFTVRADNHMISNDRLAEFLRAVPLIEDAIAGVRGEVERRLFEGQEVNGFYLGEGRKGDRKWTDDAEAQLKKRLGATNAYVKKLIGVPAAEKLLKKSKPKVWEQISKDLITQSEGKPSVCREGDKNPRYQISTAEDFAELSVGLSEQQLLAAETASGITREQAFAHNDIFDDIQWVAVEETEAERLLS